MKICTTCSVTYPDSERFCPQDGTPLRSSEASDDLVGTLIGERYQILRKLGEGGMGQVYLAEHVRMKRKSAVKVVHPRMANDADALSRFNREASNACQIQHPNVAAIYDFGETPDGIVYIAMEYVDGESLARLLASRGALPAVRAADITRQVADGLDVAHRLGIVHRDLKPDNILVASHHDGRDWIKVVDFGISKAAEQDGQTVTRTGQVVGTPNYMSPEQLSADSVDSRSDIYSLAIVAFNMLTGALPFQSDSAQSSMLARLTERPQRLAAASPSVAWTEEMQAVLDRAMELRPDARYPSASAFAAALSEAATRLPGAVYRDSHTTLGAARPAAPQPSNSPAATPTNLSFPVASGLGPSELAAIEAKLVRIVGPIAKVLVRRAAATALSREALIAALAGEIDDPGERERFRREVG